MPRTKKMGVFGGAFDPIHLGHLELARVCKRYLSLDQVRFIPSREPVLKKSCVASAEQRAKMIALAIAEEPSFVLDERELAREAPSYALLTLQSLRKEFPRSIFYWLMGEDAYAAFTHWHAWEEIAKLCHLVVVSRKGVVFSEENNALVENAFEAAGHQVIYVQMPCIPIASRHIRAEVQPRLPELPDAVRQFIVENELYELGTVMPAKAGIQASTVKT